MSSKNSEVDTILPENPDATVESKSFYTNPIIKSRWLQILSACTPLHLVSRSPSRVGLCLCTTSLRVKRKFLEAASLQFQMTKFMENTENKRKDTTHA